MKTTSVLFAGVGGQGIVLASRILAQAAFEAGLMVKEAELHGMAQRGGSVISQVRFGPEVHSPLILRGEASRLVATEELEGLRYLDYLQPGARVILNRRRIAPAGGGDGYPSDTAAALEEQGFLVTAVPAPEVAREIGNPRIENTILLGALSQYLDLPAAAWEKAIAALVPSRTMEVNLRAFRAGRRF